MLVLPPEFFEPALPAHKPYPVMQLRFTSAMHILKALSHSCKSRRTRSV